MARCTELITVQAVLCDMYAVHVDSAMMLNFGCSVDLSLHYYVFQKQTHLYIEYQTILAFKNPIL